ncbi:DC2I1-like protein [Mya arenaria]|uniref:DC2I1-like protein n=1 Tax=Mya arenaria TaxID=6604 RepID=A0ABY7E7A9_MYAAR|nr:DC2I1-like protein [Mya arenaria]
MSQNHHAALRTYQSLENGGVGDEKLTDQRFYLHLLAASSETIIVQDAIAKDKRHRRKEERDRLREERRQKREGKDGGSSRDKKGKEIQFKTKTDNKAIELDEVDDADDRRRRHGDKERRHHDDRDRRDRDKERRHRDEDEGKSRRSEDDRERRKRHDDEDDNKRRRHRDDDERRSKARDDDGDRKRRSGRQREEVNEDEERQRRREERRKEKEEEDRRRRHEEKKERRKDDRHDDRRRDDRSDRHDRDDRREKHPDRDDKHREKDDRSDRHIDRDREDRHKDRDRKETDKEKEERRQREREERRREKEEKKREEEEKRKQEQKKEEDDDYDYEEDFEYNRQQDRQQDSDEDSDAGYEKTYQPRRDRPKTAINFVSAKQRAMSNKTASKTQQRGRDLLKMIELDYTYCDILDLPPVNEYDLYIRSFGSTNTRQTEEADVRSKWTQHPPEDFRGCGRGDGEKDQEEEESQHQDTDMGRLNHFLEKAGQVIAILLEEGKENESGHQGRSQTHIAVSEGYTQIDLLPILQGRHVVYSHFSPVQPNMLVTAYSLPTEVSEENTVSKRGVLILVCTGQPRCCCFSPVRPFLVFAGMTDGSIAIWCVERGKSPQPRLLHASSGLSFQLVSTEEAAVVAEIGSPDISGAQNDFGLLPGGGGFVVHGIRFGKRVFPRAHSPVIESIVEVSSIDFSPFGQPCFLAGSSDGTFSLYTTQSENPLITWPHLTKGHKVQCVRWSRSRPCVFYVLDSAATLYVFDLLEGDMNPKNVETVTSFSLTTDQRGEGSSGKLPQMLFSLESGKIEIHTVAKSLREPDQLETDYLASYLQRF